MPADIKSSQTQIAQSTLDEVNQAVKVNIVAASGAGGIATEATADRIADATESIDTKTPADPATETKQDTGNASLASIDSKTPALVSGRQPVDGSGVTQPISAVSLPLPTDAATETTLASINTKTPALLSGASPVISGLGIPSHDALTYTSGMTTDTYIYYSGGLAGTQVSQVLITYTDNTKAILQSVVRS